MAYTVKVFDGGVEQATLSDVHGLSWMVEHNGTGSGQFQVPHDATGVAELIFGRVARIYDGAALRGGIFLEPPERDRMNRREASGKIVHVHGRGPAAVLEWGLVYPEGGIGGLDESTRWFSWASASFDDSPWSQAYDMGSWRNPDDPFKPGRNPDDWPDPRARRLWSEAPTLDANGTLNHPAGTVYFRREFTVASETEATVFFSVDGSGELYLDGAKLVESTTSAELHKTHERSVIIPAGDHVLAIKARNGGTPTTSANNTGDILASIATVDEEGNIDTVLVRTDGGSGWRVLGYPAEEPGMVFGEIFRLLLTESQARNELDGVTTSITDAAGTDSVAWSQIINHGLRVGTNMLSALEQLAEIADVDWRATPALQVDAWEARGVDRGATPDTGATTVQLVEGSNIVDSSYPARRPVGNRLLVETPEGYAQADDAPSQSTHGVLAASATVGTARQYEGLSSFLSRTFRHGAEPQQLPTIVTDGTGGATPGEDFDEADTISAPDDGGIAGDWRVASYAVEQDDENGERLFTVELEPV